MQKLVSQHKETVAASKAREDCWKKSINKYILPVDAFSGPPTLRALKVDA